MIEKAYRSAYYILKSSHYAEEAVQKSMIEAYKNIIAGKNIRNFPSWFTNLVCCRSIDIARQNVKLNEKTIAIDNQNHILEKSTILDSIIEEEEKNELNEAIMSIENVSYRTVITMYYYQDLSVSKISETLNLNPSTVKTHLKRARQALSSNTRLKNSYRGELI